MQTPSSVFMQAILTHRGAFSPLSETVSVRQGYCNKQRVRQASI